MMSLTIICFTVSSRFEYMTRPGMTPKMPSMTGTMNAEYESFSSGASIMPLTKIAMLTRVTIMKKLIMLFFICSLMTLTSC